MGAANRRPARSVPQLLVLPWRARVERAVRLGCGNPEVRIVALELERNQSLALGDVLELVVVVFFPEPHQSKRLTVRHVMPGRQANERGLTAGAEVLGQMIRMRFRGYGGKWAAPVLSDDLAG